MVCALDDQSVFYLSCTLLAALDAVSGSLPLSLEESDYATVYYLETLTVSALETWMVPTL